MDKIEMKLKKIGAIALDANKIDLNILDELVKTFFRNYEKGLLRTDIYEAEILALNEKERYNLFYVCYLKTISVIPTIEMSNWINERFSPDYDICGGAGNLGFCLGIPTSDSHFRLGDEFADRIGTLEEKAGGSVMKPDFTLCENTKKITGNAVAKMKDVNTVIGSWILVQHPSKVVNEALKIMDSIENNSMSVQHLNPTKKVKKMIESVMKKGSVGIPNGLNLKGLLENANLVFIGNFNVHSPTHIKELYSMYKHITYTYDDLPFSIIDKQWLRSNERGGFVKFFPKKGKIR